MIDPDDDKVVPARSPDEYEEESEHMRWPMATVLCVACVSLAAGCWAIAWMLAQ